MNLFVVDIIVIGLFISVGNHRHFVRYDLKKEFFFLNIYQGNGLVVHRWGDHDGVGKSVGFLGNFLTFSGTQFDKATILQTKIDDVLALGGKARVNNYLDKKYKYDTVKTKDEQKLVSEA